jgi:hypothetical protein
MPQTALLTLTGGPRPFVVRTNPNYISYAYTLRTQTYPTFGGKVVQILGVNFETLRIEIESGSNKVENGQPGGYAYFREVIKWFKETSLWQRNTKKAIRFTYPARNYVLDVFLKNLYIADDLQNVLRPLQIEMEIEDDFTGLLSGDIVKDELKYFQDGIGYSDNPYNNPDLNIDTTDTPPVPPGTGGGPGNLDDRE